MAQPTRTFTRAAEYFQLPDYEMHNLIELIDGEVVFGRPPTPIHQRVVRDLLFLLTTISRNKGGEAFASPIEVVLDELNVYEPDVIYLKPNSLCVVGEKRLTGAPDLVVEVLSPSTAKYDRQEKYEAYERHGVNEYWIVDPVHALVEVYTLSPEGTFSRRGAFSSGDTFSSISLGEDVAVESFLGAQQR